MRTRRHVCISSYELRAGGPGAPSLSRPPVVAGAMADLDSDVPGAPAAAPVLSVLRSMTWTARAAVLHALREADLSLWVRCVSELGPDEVLFSASAILHVEDLGGAVIPLMNRAMRQSTLSRFGIRSRRVQVENMRQSTLARFGFRRVKGYDVRRRLRRKTRVLR